MAEDLFATGFRLRLRTLSLLSVGLGLFYIVSVWHMHDNLHSLDSGNGEELRHWKHPEQREQSLMCAEYPHTANIAISVKTGATEAFQKLPALLSTSLSCARDVMFFSDLEQNFGGLHLRDVLARISPAIRDNNPAFEIYQKQKELQSQHRENELPALADMPAPPRNDWGRGNKAAWALDKYKFLPMMEMAYELQPGREWCVFLEADTYISWPNLMSWLSTLDSKNKLYLGMPLRKSDVEPLIFHNGGAGYILSGPALSEFVSKGVTNWW